MVHNAFPNKVVTLGRTHLLTPPIILILFVVDFANTIGFWDTWLLDNPLSFYMYLFVEFFNILL
jgi:hypothetical protein